MAVLAFAMLHNVDVHAQKNHNVADATLTIAGKTLASFVLSSTAHVSHEIVSSWLHYLLLVVILVSGGYDKRLKENVEYLEELKSLAEKEGVSHRVRFITSCSTAERKKVVSSCMLVWFSACQLDSFVPSYSRCSELFLLRVWTLPGAGIG